MTPKQTKQRVVLAVKSRFKPSNLDLNHPLWEELEKVLWKLSIEDLNVLEEAIFNHSPDIPNGTCI